MKVGAGTRLMWTPVPGVKVDSWPIALDAEGGNTDANLFNLRAFL